MLPLKLRVHNDFISMLNVGCLCIITDEYKSKALLWQCYM